MQRRFRRKLMLAGLVAGGGFLFGGQSTSCFTFTGETMASSADFCFIFDCQNGILGGTLDPCSQTRGVLNHIGGLLRVGPYANRDDEVLPEWRRGVEEVANCPNIVMKLGGVGQLRYGYHWDDQETPIGSQALAETLGPLMEHCIQQFGPTRCMFESNFPVDKISYSYNVVFNAFKRLSKSYSASERAAMFHDTATRVYRIDV